MLFRRKREKLNSMVEELNAAVSYVASEVDESPLAAMTRKFEELSARVRNEEFLSLIGRSHQPEFETRRALIDVFLRVLGYDVSDVTVVCCERLVPRANDTDKSVDYTIAPAHSALPGCPQDNSSIIVEAKVYNKSLDLKRDGVLPVDQLAGYFYHIDSAEIAILTNGKEYRFYGCDPAAALEGKRQMASAPFFVMHFDKETVDVPEWIQYLSYDAYDAKKIPAYTDTLKDSVKARMSGIEISGDILAAFKSAVGSASSLVSDETFVEWLSEVFVRKEDSIQ